MTTKHPLIHNLYASPMTGEEIETASFAAIDREAASHAYSSDQWAVVRRLIHTTADFELAKSLFFSPGAIASGITALQSGKPMYTDSNMIRSGLSLVRLQKMNTAYSAESIVCYIKDKDVAHNSREQGLPRSLFALRKAKPILDGGIVVFGNAPVALLELNRLIIEENIRPALIIAMPVGFVHVVESKEELMTLDVPHIAIVGRRGGSPLAVAAIHALCELGCR